MSPDKAAQSPGKRKSPCSRCSNESSRGYLQLCSPSKWRSLRLHSIESQNGNGKIRKSPRKKLLDQFPHKPKWNPRDSVQMSAVMEALDSTTPSSVVCREDEQKKVFEFCKECVEQEKSGSLYVCGCPGTGKTLSIEKVKITLEEWAKDEGFQPPNVLDINCVSLANASEIFLEILQEYCPRKKANGSCLPLEQLRKLFSQKKLPSIGRMMLLIIDEIDYLITKDYSVLHNLFMLTTYPFSRLILVGIANAIDLADRFLPKLQSMNCKPIVVTFHAYSKDQILMILQQRLMAFEYDTFQPQALDLCARKVAAASGDMRKALDVCRGAIKILEAELTKGTKAPAFSSMEKTVHTQSSAIGNGRLGEQEINLVRYDHMALAWSKTFKSTKLDTIQSLPQHQQMILCSVVKLFRQGKDATIFELNKLYTDICASARISPASMSEFSNMCKVLSEQGLISLSQSRQNRRERVALKVDEEDIIFALQGIHLYESFLR